MDTTIISDCNHIDAAANNHVAKIDDTNSINNHKNKVDVHLNENISLKSNAEDLDKHNKDEKTTTSDHTSLLNESLPLSQSQIENNDYQDGEASEEGEIDEEFDDLLHEPEVKEYKKVVRSIGVHLRCTCCGKVYSDPVTLKCGHPIDRDCAAVKLRFNQIACPMCRKRDRVASVDDLVTDFDLASQIPPKPQCWFERKQKISAATNVSIIRSSSVYSDDDYENEEDGEYYEDRKASKSKKKAKKKKKNKNKKQFSDWDNSGMNNNQEFQPSKRPCLSQPVLPVGFDASVPPPGFVPPLIEAPPCSVPSNNSVSWLPSSNPCQPSSNTPFSSSRPLSALERQQLALQEGHKPNEVKSPFTPPLSGFNRPVSVSQSSHSQTPIVSNPPTPSSSGASQFTLMGGFSSQPLLQTPQSNFSHSSSSSASNTSTSSTTQSHSNTSRDVDKVNELYNHAYDLYQKALSAGYANHDSMSGQQYMQFYQQMMSSLPQNMMMNSMFSSFNQWQQYFQQYMQQYMQQFFHQYAMQTPTSSCITSPSSSSNKPVPSQENQNNNTSLVGGFQLTDSSTPPVSNESNIRQSDQERTKYLWISNLPDYIKAKDIKILCLPHGRATNIKIATSKKVSPKVIMAYITLDSVESAEKIFNSLDGKNFQGSTLKVKYIKTNPFESSNPSN